MQLGFWINYSKNKTFRIDEHETWIRRWQNAKKAGVHADIFEEFSEYEPIEDRDEFLMYVMEKVPLIRMRGHGQTFTFEFNTRRAKKPLEAIWEFGMDYAGDYSNFYIVNFATKETVSMLYKDFEEIMMDGRESDLMRAAKKITIRRGSQDMQRILGKDNVKPLDEQK